MQVCIGPSDEQKNLFSTYIKQDPLPCPSIQIMNEPKSKSRTVQIDSNLLDKQYIMLSSQCPNSRFQQLCIDELKLEKRAAFRNLWFCNIGQRDTIFNKIITVGTNSLDKHDSVTPKSSCDSIASIHTDAYSPTNCPYIFSHNTVPTVEDMDISPISSPIAIEVNSVIEGKQNSPNNLLDPVYFSPSHGIPNSSSNVSVTEKIETVNSLVYKIGKPTEIVTEKNVQKAALKYSSSPNDFPSGLSDASQNYSRTKEESSCSNSPIQIIYDSRNQTEHTSFSTQEAIVKTEPGSPKPTFTSEAATTEMQTSSNSYAKDEVIVRPWSPIIYSDESSSDECYGSRLNKRKMHGDRHWLTGVGDILAKLKLSQKYATAQKNKSNLLEKILLTTSKGYMRIKGNHEVVKRTSKNDINKKSLSYNHEKLKDYSHRTKSTQDRSRDLTYRNSSSEKNMHCLDKRKLRTERTRSSDIYEDIHERVKRKFNENSDNDSRRRRDSKRNSQMDSDMHVKRKLNGNIDRDSTRRKESKRTSHLDLDAYVETKLNENIDSDSRKRKESKRTSHLDLDMHVEIKLNGNTDDVSRRRKESKRTSDVDLDMHVETKLNGNSDKDSMRRRESKETLHLCSDKHVKRKLNGAFDNDSNGRKKSKRTSHMNLDMPVETKLNGNFDNDSRRRKESNSISHLDLNTQVTTKLYMNFNNDSIGTKTSTKTSHLDLDMDVETNLNGILENDSRKRKESKRASYLDLDMHIETKSGGNPVNDSRKQNESKESSHLDLDMLDETELNGNTDIDSTGTKKLKESSYLDLDTQCEKLDIRKHKDRKIKLIEDKQHRNTLSDVSQYELFYQNIQIKSEKHCNINSEDLFDLPEDYKIKFEYNNNNIDTIAITKETINLNTVIEKENIISHEQVNIKTESDRTIILKTEAADQFRGPNVNFLSDKCALRNYLLHYTGKLMQSKDESYGENSLYPVFLRVCEKADVQNVEHSQSDNPSNDIWDRNLRRFCATITYKHMDLDTANIDLKPEKDIAAFMEDLMLMI